MPTGRSIISRHLIGAFGSMLLLISSASAAPPAQLYGKSVVVTWTDEVVHALVGQEFFRSSHPSTMSVYISTEGRPFVRHTTKVHQGTGVSEAVGTSGPHTVAFQGRALLVTTAYEGGASRVQIDFDGSFGNCTAAVIIGKAPGASTFTVEKGLVTGRKWVVQSREAGPATCSIKNGNVFAE